MVVCLKLNIAQECHENHNFATAISIANALQELNIRALKMTQKGVGEKVLRDMDKLRLECLNRTAQFPSSQSSPTAIWPLEFSERIRQNLFKVTDKSFGTRHPT